MRNSFEHRGSFLSFSLVLIASLLLAAPAMAGPPAPVSDPCVVADDGTGTVELPPPGCGYLSPDEVHMIIDGLPPGTEIILAPIHMQFICRQAGGVCGEPGGTLGGEIEIFDSILHFEVTGTGELDGFRRILQVPAPVQTQTGPRTPGDPVQTFPTEMVSLQGALFGDPDFAELIVTAGTGLGLPSPGSTTLTSNGDGTFNVDSFFDITYQIDFLGAPGSILDGLAGTTVGAPLRVEARQTCPPHVEPDNGQGTVTLPPLDGKYVSPTDLHMMIAGLPPGTSIEIRPEHRFFFCPPPTPCGEPGGSLGGEIEQFWSVLQLEMTGTGELAGFQRQIVVDAFAETHTGPRAPTGPVQDFPTEMFALIGDLPPGDPDFDQLVIQAGSLLGLPSPGHTTLTNNGDGTFQVDSFFDITYRIDFQGAPGSILQGMGGATTATVRMSICPDDTPLLRGTVKIVVDAQADAAQDFEYSGGMGDFLLDDDGDATLSSSQIIIDVPAGTYDVTGLPPVGWTLLSINCVDPDGGSSSTVATGIASIDLDASETVTCTFTHLDPTFIFTDGFESGDTAVWSSSVP